MTLDIRCPGCGKTLRIGDEHAGKQVRCPACQQISIAPAAAASAATFGATTVGAGGAWHMRTPEGQTYGPASWSQLQAWASEGRLAADCQVAENPAGPWRGAAELFPALTPAKALPATPAPPTVHTWLPSNVSQDDSAPFAASAYSPFAPGSRSSARYIVPHRGGLILILGLLGFAINCPIFCFMALVMGAADLREMRAGRMDPSGEPLTQVGRILGMILSLLWILFGAIVLLVVLLAAVNGA
jgi:phage FluMu protein Com